MPFTLASLLYYDQLKMSILQIHRKSDFGLRIPIPYHITVNGRIIGMTQLDNVNIELPAAYYNIGISYIFKIWKFQFSLTGKKDIIVKDNERIDLTFYHKERIWNILFDIDLILWLAELFFELPYPWNFVYKIISNSFFVIWLTRLFLIRDKYFTFDIKYDQLL